MPILMLALILYSVLGFNNNKIYRKRIIYNLNEILKMMTQNTIQLAMMKVMMIQIVNLME